MLLLHVNALNHEEFRSTFERLWSVLFWTWGCNFPNQLVFDSFMIEKNQSYNFFAGFGTFSIRGICLSFFCCSGFARNVVSIREQISCFFRQNFRIPPRGTSCAGSTEEVPSPRCPCFVQSTQGRASVRPRARRSTGSGFCLSTDKQVLADDVGSWLSRPDIFIQDSCLSIIPNHSKTSATN